MKRLSWKYVAGLIDGEGCIDLQFNYSKKYPGRPYIRPKCRINMSEPAKFLLDMFHANFEGDHHILKRSFKNPNWANAYSWGLHGKKLRPFLQNIVNHLFLKKEQAKFAIWTIDNVMGKHVSNELRERLKNEMKAMKRDPHRLSETAVREIKMNYFIWSPYSNQCFSCGETEKAHEGKGYCKSCYSALMR